MRDGDAAEAVARQEPMAPVGACVNAQLECTMCRSPSISRQASVAFQARRCHSLPLPFVAVVVEDVGVQVVGQTREVTAVGDAHRRGEVLTTHDVRFE